ncbi:cytochrome P450 CYP736A12-like [Lycium ferocissimum]|uniref:cytochrome P450 CYP736A12-like n=1 Tax=Lycium ferocissimum TaxID=112874 RepID=UPI002815C1B0|nr:cytochrome P450 CYP736A12-like [Lycium ferocissimum]
MVIKFYDVQRDPNIWPKPDKCLPQRFVGSSIDVHGRDFQLLPFGFGRRSYPGMQLGIVLVRLLLAQLVHCFDWELPNGWVQQPSLKEFENLLSSQELLAKQMANEYIKEGKGNAPMSDKRNFKVEAASGRAHSQF